MACKKAVRIPPLILKPPTSAQQSHAHVEELLRVDLHLAIREAAAAAPHAATATAAAAQCALLPAVCVVVAALGGVGQAGEGLGHGCRGEEAGYRQVEGE